MKKIFVVFLVLLTVCIFSGCTAKKILHCDNCNAEVKVSADSAMEEDWTIYCSECNK